MKCTIHHAAYAVLALPLFSAGIAFAQCYGRVFRSVALGYNLVGAMAGGVLERF